jgi:predicted ferric reductase
MRKIIVSILVLTSLVFGASFVLPATVFAATVQSLNSTDTNNSEIDIEIQSLPGSPVTNQLKERASSTWPWYLTRASGITAAVLLVVIMLSGMGFITGHTFAFLEPINAWATHRAMGIALGVSVGVHMISLLFDHFLPFSVSQILIPFASKYKPVNFGHVHLGSLYVAFGVLAFYLLITVVITSLLLIDKKTKLWKLVHLMSYLVILFVFVHAVKIGTDLSHGLFKYIWIGAGMVIVAMLLVRLRRTKTT